MSWFESYLTNRKQYIVYDEGKTNYETIKCGVPQGSILGPLLFLIYINDLNKFSNILNTILFADDTSLFYSNKDINILFQTFNKELDKLTQWFKSNKLSLNIRDVLKLKFCRRRSFGRSHFAEAEASALYMLKV